ncbi:MAG: hypothetical protein V1831_02720 [Candidatus Woesearchaeota archaeon]
MNYEDKIARLPKGEREFIEKRSSELKNYLKPALYEDRIDFIQNVGGLISAGMVNDGTIKNLEERTELTTEEKDLLIEVKELAVQTKVEVLERLKPWINRDQEYIPTKKFNPRILARFANAIEKYWDSDFSKVLNMQDSLDLYKSRNQIA